MPNDVIGLVFKVASPVETEIGEAKTSLILMNLGTTIQNVDFSGAELGTPIGGVETSASLDWQEGSVGNSVLVPGLSIITLLFD